ncbi:hypothetical protein AB1I56_09810 [Staphylococcus epidermidis]
MNEHEIFREKLENIHYRIQVLGKHVQSQKWIEEYIKEYEYNNMLQGKLIMECLKSMTNDYYIEIVDEDGIMNFYIVDKEYKSICNFYFAINVSNKVTKSLINKYKIILEVKSLHSYAKYKGETIVNNIKKMSEQVKAPICLFDTNTKSKKYYTNLGFVNKGKIGSKREKLMVYEPQIDKY